MPVRRVSLTPALCRLLQWACVSVNPLAALVVVGMSLVTASALAAPRTEYPRAVVPPSAITEARTPGHIVREQLSPNELAARQAFSLELQMHHFDELTARIARGEVLKLAELQERYLPTREEWHRVAEWAASQGLDVKPEDPSHLTVFAEGSTARVSDVLQTRFARVTGTDAREYTSAVSAPSLPSEIAGLVHGVRNLQPHLQLIRQQSVTPSQVDGNVTPQTIAQLYNAAGAGFDGQGQTIVVRGGGAIDTNDLVTFWTRCGLPTTLGQLTMVNVTGPSNPVYPTEMTMDIEWASAMAPRANIVYFGSPDEGQLFSWITTQTVISTPILQTTLSAALPEATFTNGLPPQSTQYYAAMAALGISNFVASGDHGTNANVVGNTAPGAYSVYGDGPVTVDYPSSDPFVIATGGTIVQFGRSGNVATVPVAEGAWTFPVGQPPSTWVGVQASTGGLSRFFARPAWQTGNSLLTGNWRAVPDVAAVAASNFSLYIVVAGQTQAAGGTSLSAPIWAGLSALINQGLIRNGTPAAFLAPRLYSLIGTPAFHQITTGAANAEAMSASATNGIYTPAADFNYLTGLGSPDVAQIITALSPSAATPPAITVQPVGVTTTSGGSATFSVTASGTGPLFYQWLFNGMPVHDGVQAFGSSASGSQTETFVMTQVQVTESSTTLNRVGNNPPGVAVVVTNAAGTVLSNLVSLNVTIPPNAPVVTAFPTTQWQTQGVLGQDTIITINPSNPSSYTYQWYHNGLPVAGGVQKDLTINNTAYSDSGLYFVLLTNASGTTSSPILSLTIAAANSVTPIVTQGITSLTKAIGEAAQFTVTAAAPGPITYKWYHDGNLISGANGASYTIASVTAADAGAYRVLLESASGTGIYSDATLTIPSPNAPVITGQPNSQNVTVGASVSFTVTVTGPSPTFQWKLNGTPITGATSASYSIGSVQTGDAGSYTVVVTNSYGTATSYVASLVVNPVVTPPPTEIAPAIVTQPASQSIVAGNAVTFSVVVTGTSPTFQWMLNGGPILGARSSSYSISAVQPSQAGSYSVTVSNPLGTVTSNVAMLTVTQQTAPDSVLVNLSIRTSLAPNQRLIPGFVVNGSKLMLLRLGGPVLNQYGLSGLPDPKLQLYNSASTMVAENDNWDASLRATAARLGAFPYDDNSKDAGLIATLSGVNSAFAFGPSSGTVLMELYDTQVTDYFNRLVNMSARNHVGTGADTLIAGFVIVGTGNKQVLIRGIGPKLASYGVPDVLADPYLQVYDAAGNQIAANDNWDATLGSAFTRVGAFALDPGSKDAALLISLPPGIYSAKLSGVGNTVGEGLLEIYEVWP